MGIIPIHTREIKRSDPLNTPPPPQVSRTYGDPSRRPEVREATIEFIAPQEYMLRPPQPASYIWVLDVTRQAMDTGYLKVRLYS